MIDTNSLPLFVIAALTLLLIPGPAVLYVVTRSVHQGWRAGIASVLGLHFGTGFHILAAVLGLSAILLSSALAFDIVKYLGAAYLIYMGVCTLMSSEQKHEETRIKNDSLVRVFSQGVIVEILNPKTALFFFAFLPQFVDSSRGSVSMQMFLLGMIFLGLGILTDSMYAFLAGGLGNLLKTNRFFAFAQRYIAGTIYICLGLTTALTGTRKQ